MTASFVINDDASTTEVIWLDWDVKEGTTE
jgi:hypothetical protein